MKVKQGQLPTIKMTYAHLNRRIDTQDPNQPAPTVLGYLMRKLDQAEVDNVAACRLNRVIVEVKKAIAQMETDYRRDVIGPFQKRLEADGLLKKTAEEIHNMSVEEQEKFKPHNEWNTEQNIAFGKREYEFNVLPLGPQHLAGVKISPAEIRALQGLFDEGGAERTKAFKAQLGIAPDSGHA